MAVTARQKEAAVYLAPAGWAANGVAGVIGNLVGESGENLSSVVHRKHADHGSGGIAEWRLDRLQSLIDFAQHEGKAADDLGVQCLFLIHEVQTDYPHLDAMLKDPSRSIANQAANFCWIFERPNKQLANVDGRIKAATALAAGLVSARVDIGPSVATAGVLATAGAHAISLTPVASLTLVGLVLITLIIRIIVIAVQHGSADPQARYRAALAELVSARAALLKQEEEARALLGGVV